MKTELVDHSPTHKELKIEIDAETVRAEYDRISDRYAKAASVPGFRKGHAPRAVVRQRFKQEIRGEVLRELVPQALNDAINESALHVIGEPDIHLDDEAALEKFGDRPISLHAHLEVMPEVTLGEYKGLEAARRTRPVTDEMVEKMIEDLRESSASLQPVEERGAEMGDSVTVDFQGRYLVPPSDEDINAEDVEVVLGGDGVLEEFTNQLLGTRPDDVKTFVVKYPEDFSSKGLAGKEIEYTATVSAVRRKELPELDDEWAQSLGEELESVDKLRERVRENLEGRAKFEAEQTLRTEVMRKLIAAHQFEVPESLVEQQSQGLLRSYLQEMVQQGLDPRSQEINWEALRGAFRPQATEDLRGSFLLERIAEQENLEVTDAEVESEINTLAEVRRQTPEQVRAALTKQGGERSIADRLRHRKALDFLVDNASVREEEWREEDEPAGAAQAETENQPTGDTNASANAPTTSDATANEAEPGAGEATGHNTEV
ncbi:MAG TPA: trigger factor [Pyrinomonadaceae bacterium]|jgi:trigger factor|nr:trigger factor [Pyrinomonadaceae bacterium]